MTSSQPLKVTRSATNGQESRRDRLIAVGLKTFGGRDVAGIVMDDIAEEAGISKGLLYHYFGSKRAFYVEVVRAAAEGLVREARAPEAGSGAEQVRTELLLYLRYVEQHATGFVMLLQGALGSDPEVREIVEGTREEFALRVVAGLQPTPSTDEERIVVRGWIGLVEAATLEWLKEPNVPAEQLSGILAHCLIASLEGL